ncbi:MAG: hypothetical protein HY778_00390 [Betaproteobacteria bacterium]|nr:hypothetical protein [Betaproteobacteria bacterium]
MTPFRAAVFPAHLTHPGSAPAGSTLRWNGRASCGGRETEPGVVARYLRQHMPQLRLTSIDAALVKL